MNPRERVMRTIWALIAVWAPGTRSDLRARMEALYELAPDCGNKTRCRG